MALCANEHKVVNGQGKISLKQGLCYEIFGIGTTKGKYIGGVKGGI